MRLIGYGGMLTESFVAVMALICASILDQHLYFALNAPTARTGGTAVSTAAVGPDGHADRVMAEDLFRRPQRWLLDSAFPVRRRPSSR